MAFLGQEGWKAGLPNAALAKIEDMETQITKLNREKTQRTLRQESLEQSMEKQKQRVGEKIHELI